MLEMNDGLLDYNGYHGLTFLGSKFPTEKALAHES